MAYSVFVTGIAGTGKSTICKELQRCGYNAYDIEYIDGLFTMIDKNTGKPVIDWDNNDVDCVKRCRWVCDKTKLEELMRKHARGTVYYCGVAANYDELSSLFDQEIVLHACPDVLRVRLSNRADNNFAKTSEVQEWLFDSIGPWMDRCRKRGATFVDANGALEDTVSAVIQARKIKEGIK